MLNLIDFRLVIETLEGVEKDRKCFRMVGGVLVERKVGEVEPALVSNRDKVRLNKDCIEMKFCNRILEFSAGFNYLAPYSNPAAISKAANVMPLIIL